MGLIFKDADKPVDAKTERLYAALFSVIVGTLALIAIVALVFLLHDEIGSGFRMPRQYAMGLLSAAIVCGGLILLLYGIRAKKEAIKAAATQKDWDDKPWLLRKDWAGGRIVSSLRKAVWLMDDCRFLVRRLHRHFPGRPAAIAAGQSRRADGPRFDCWPGGDSFRLANVPRLAAVRPKHF